MKIALLGAGHVGTALGTAWSGRGHEIYFGVRDPGAPETREMLAACGSGARAGAPADAARFADVLAIALPWSAVESVLRPLDLIAKIVIDCTNPPPGVGGSEVIAKTCPGAKVAKCFNITGANNMANPRYPEGAASMFACSDDPDAKAAALRLAADAGFEAFDLGPLSNAGLMESFAKLWIWLASRGGLGREFAFRVIRR